MQTNSTLNKKQKKKPAKDAIIDLANKLAEPIRSLDGRYYIALKGKEHLALPLSGSNSQAIHEICNQYYVQNNKWIGREGINNLTGYLTTRCSLSDPVEVNLRAGTSGDAIFLDYGDVQGHVLKVDAEGVQLCDKSSVVFTGSMVTGQFPKLVEEAANLREDQMHILFT